MALERCVDHVVTALQAAECTSARAEERIELGDAWRELLAHRGTWCKRYPEELRNAFKTAVEPRPDSAAADAVRKERQPQELALVDDAEIMQEIESSRLVRDVLPRVEQPVSELDALVSSAMGLGSVRPELNPVRPEVFAQTLRALIDHSQVKPAIGTLWMKHMAQPLGEELQHLYGRLVTQFKSANVQPVSYRSTPSAATRAPAASEATADAAETEAGGQSPLPAGVDGRQISHALLREFLHGGAAQAGQALPASYYSEVERELAQLRSGANRPPVAAPAPVPSGYRELSPVDRPQLPVGVQSALSAEVWGDYANSHQRSLVHAQLRRDALRLAQVLGLELVRKVVNQIAQDPKLLAPVREAIVALEPSLLRLAMVDPRFFTEERHPGRLLMERVAQRSFRYNDEFGADFAAFFQDITRCFNDLNGAPIADARPFEQALAGLEGIWSELDRRDEQQRSQAVSAMRFAEMRQEEAEQIAWELGSRPDLENVPAVVQDFLFGRWALVLAHARLTDTTHQIDPHGYRSLIADLLWSVKREVTLRQPAQLFARVPGLVASLRAGLASIGQQPEDSEDFFQALMRLHHPVLKLRRAKSRRDARESGLAPLAAVEQDAPADSAATAAAEPQTGQPWMSPHELDAAGFEETLPTDMAELQAEPAVSAPAPLPPQAKPAGVAADRQPAHPAPSASDLEGIMARLREGDWFDLYSKRRWLRAQLIWASGKGTLFMFVSHGGRPHSMTRRVCERLVRDRYLRPVQLHGVVSRALDTLEREPDPGCSLH